MKKGHYLLLILLTSLCLIACGNEKNAEQTPEIQAAETEESDETITVVPTETEEPKAEPTAEPTKEAKPTAIPEPTEEPTPEVAKTAETANEATPTSEPVATSTEPVTAVSLSSKISGNHSVGDTLAASDFTITVTMSDGSTVKNPAGWNADKLTLDSESTVITVTYNCLSTTVTVKAQQKPQAQPQQPATEPEPSVGEPPTTGGWPASAYGAVTDAAIADCYNYAVAHGWVIHYGSTDAFGGWSGSYYVKNGQSFSFEMGYLLWNSTLYFPGEYTMADAYRLIDSV